MTGYFEGGNDICDTCSNRCLECSNPATACTTCAGTTRSAAPSCACIDGYYDDGSSADCIQCQYSCLTCNDGTSCLTCDSSKYRSFSSTTNLCKCMNRYYDDGTSTTLCSACDPTCLTCLGPLNTDCLGCNAGSYRIYDSTTHGCICDTGYY